MSDIADEHQSLPSYGQNGRDLILKAARELESKSGRRARERSPVAQPQPDYDDDSYCAAVPPANRPTIAYDPRAKIPRVVRQVALTRFVAQRLRLAARAVPHAQKLAFVAQQHIWTAAIQDARAQEAALLTRAGHKQVLYSNLLARTKAEDAAATAGPSQQPPVQQAAKAVATGGEAHSASEAADGRAKAELGDAGQSPCSPEDSLQPAVERDQGGPRDAPGAGTQQSTAARAVHVGSKRKHAEAQLMHDDAVEVRGTDSC